MERRWATEDTDPTPEEQARIKTALLERIKECEDALNKHVGALRLASEREARLEEKLELYMEAHGNMVVLNDSYAERGAQLKKEIEHLEASNKELEEKIEKMAKMCATCHLVKDNEHLEAENQRLEAIVAKCMIAMDKGASE